MPSPYMMPNQSGLDTQAIISKLIEAERTPLKRLEEDNKRNEIRIQAWEELQGRAKKLSDLSKDIYSFTGPFATKTLISSDESSISGNVSFSSDVNEIQQKIQVLQLASYHKIRSREISEAEILPSGEFSITIDNNQFHFQFNGGNIDQLYKLFQEKSGKFYEVSKVNLTSSSYVLTINSLVSGEKGKIKLFEKDNLLKNIELAGNVGKPEEKEEKINPLKEKFSIPTEKENQVQIQGSKWTSKGPLQYNYHFSINEKVKQIDFSYFASLEQKVERETNQKETIIMGPTIKDKVFDVELYAPHIEVERTTSNNQDKIIGSDFSIKIHWESYGVKKEKEFPLKGNGKVQIKLEDLGENEPIKLISMDVYHNFEGILGFENIKVIKINEEKTSYDVLHEIEPARDAVLKVNGIEVKRDKNDNISDLIPGISLNLHKPTNGEVSLKVQANVQEIKEKIKNWVTTYNELITFIKDNDKFNKDQDFLLKRSTSPHERIEDGFRKLEDENGIFAGDPIARRIVNILNIIIGSSYPTKLPPKFRMLSDIGISTGKIGSDWKDIKKGLLILDEEKLEQSLKNYPDAVKELFAMDKNEDAIIDDGVAFKISQELFPYVQFSGGIITSRISLLKEKIRENKKIITSKELSLMRKEEMLRQKFGRMESSIRSSRETGNILKNRLGITNE